MISEKTVTKVTENIQTINDLVNSLSEGERTKFDKIFRSINIPKNEFDQFSSWSDESYTRNCIVETDSFELILLCWEKGQFTAIHDHGGEECWVYAIDGAFKETIFRKKSETEMTQQKSTDIREGGITFMVDFIGFHRLENTSDKRGMSLHLYAKPIRSCQVFDEERSEFTTKELAYTKIFNAS